MANPLDTPEGVSTHLKMVGILHIVVGGFGLLCTFACGVIFLAMAGVFSVGMSQMESQMPHGMSMQQGHQFFAGWLALGVLFVVMLGVCSVPGLAGGIALLRMRGWARWVLVVLSVCYCLAVPIGTLVGGYSLWVLLNPAVASRFTPAA